MKDRMTPQARTYAKLIAVLLLVGLIATVIAAKAEGATTPARVPCKQCHYVADHRATVDYTATPGTGSGNGGAGGWRQQRWEMITGFTGFRISKVGRVHVNSGEWLGQDEYGPHAFNQVAFYVRKATPPGRKPIQPKIVGGEITDPTHVTDPYYFPRFATGGRVNVSSQVGETLDGLEGVFVADNRGTYLVTIVTVNDAPFARRSGR